MRMGGGRFEGANPRNPIRHKLCGLRSVRCERVISPLPRIPFATGIGYSGNFSGYFEDLRLTSKSVNSRVSSAKRPVMKLNINELSYIMRSANK
jgi:hypothetical protein